MKKNLVTVLLILQFGLRDFLNISPTACLVTLWLPSAEGV